VCVGSCVGDVASSQESIGNALLATEVGVKREKAIVDRTTNLLNQLMYKVQTVSPCNNCVGAYSPGGFSTCDSVCTFV
jgi:hypothetical protein